MKNKNNILVTLSDNNRIDQAKQLFSSVYHNAGWQGDYMLLAHEVDDEKLGWFTKRGILVKRCKPLTDKLIGMMQHNPVILDKFYLFSTDFRKWKNIVFLDSDIIVRGSLDKLANIKGFAAVKAKMKFRHLFDKEISSNSVKSKTYNPKKKTFNSGLMAFSTVIIEDNTLNDLLKLYDKHKDYSLYNEESILNMFFYGTWKELPLVYNYVISYHLYKNIKLLDNKALVYHFVWLQWIKNVRPWDKENKYYSEWKTNLKKAENIEMHEIPNVKEWGSLKILYKSFFLKYISIISLNYFKITGLMKMKYHYILGNAGKFLRKRNAKLYNKIKKLKGE